MNAQNLYGYAAVITVEIPNNPTPFEVSVTLYPADAIDTAGPDSSEGAFKVLRECTLADLMVFADHLEAEVLEEFASTPLSSFAKPGQGSVRVRLPHDVGSEIVDRDYWWRTTRVALIEGMQHREDPPQPEPTIILVDQPQATNEIDFESEEAVSDERDVDPDVIVHGETAAEQDETDLVPTITPSNGTPPAEAEVNQSDEPDDKNQISEPAGSAAAAVAKQGEPIEGAGERLNQGVDGDTAGPADFADLIIVSQPESVYEEREASEEGSAETPVQVIRRKDTENRLAGTRLPLDDPTPSAVDILFDEHPFRLAQEHASSSLTREVAGMLVGPPPEKQPNGRYVVHVTDVIAAKHTHMQGASVTYTPESWRYVNDVLRERYPDEECVIVGWYHTHPGFGIFLSNMDLFIHHNFFTQKWHIALVLDPVGRKSGYFSWNREQKEVMAYHFPWPYWAHSSW